MNSCGSAMSIDEAGTFRSVTVVVPEGAHSYQDNTDPDGDFAVVISRQPLNPEHFVTSLLSQVPGDIEVHKIRVVEDDRLDRSLDLFTLVGVGGDDVHDLRGQSVFVAEGHT